MKFYFKDGLTYQTTDFFGAGGVLKDLVDAYMQTKSAKLVGESRGQVMDRLYTLCDEGGFIVLITLKHKVLGFFTCRVYDDTMLYIDFGMVSSEVPLKRSMKVVDAIAKKLSVKEIHFSGTRYKAMERLFQPYGYIPYAYEFKKEVV